MPRVEVSIVLDLAAAAQLSLGCYEIIAREGDPWESKQANVRANMTTGNAKRG